MRFPVFRSSSSVNPCRTLPTKCSHELFTTHENALFHLFTKASLSHQLSGKFSQYHILLILQRDLLRRWDGLDKERSVLVGNAKDLFLSYAPGKRRVRFPFGGEKLRYSVSDNREDREGMCITPGRRPPYRNYVRRGSSGAVAPSFTNKRRKL